MIPTLGVVGGVVGVDLGATLTKLVAPKVLGSFGGSWLRLPSQDLGAVRAQLEHWRPQRIGATGGGAGELGASLAGTTILPVREFDAWGRGAPLIARASGIELPPSYLLVSLGTGTSALVVRDGTVDRVGGSALGGGTLLGLGRLLVGETSFQDIARLAAQGDRRKVDLLVRDIYRQGNLPLPGDLNAASFGKLESTERADLADALMGLVGENVGIIATALAKASGVETIVFCGSTLDENPALEAALSFATRAFGGQPLYLPRGAYCGAVGAAAIAEEG